MHAESDTLTGWLERYTDLTVNGGSSTRRGPLYPFIGGFFSLGPVPGGPEGDWAWISRFTD